MVVIQGRVLCRPDSKESRWPIKGEMMKSGCVSVCKVILPVILLVLVFVVSGCSSLQPGETAAEGHRRHLRVVRINQQEMMAEIDTVLMLDQPSKLTDKRIP